MYTLIRRRGRRKRHLYNGKTGEGRSERHRTLCDQRIGLDQAMLSYNVVDAAKIDCEDCLIWGIRLAARKEEMAAQRN